MVSTFYQLLYLSVFIIHAIIAFILFLILKFRKLEPAITSTIKYIPDGFFIFIFFSFLIIFIIFLLAISSLIQQRWV